MHVLYVLQANHLVARLYQTTLFSGLKQVRATVSRALLILLSCIRCVCSFNIQADHLVAGLRQTALLSRLIRVRVTVPVLHIAKAHVCH